MKRAEIVYLITLRYMDSLVYGNTEVRILVVTVLECSSSTMFLLSDHLSVMISQVQSDPKIQKIVPKSYPNSKYYSYR